MVFGNKKKALLCCDTKWYCAANNEFILNQIKYYFNTIMRKDHGSMRIQKTLFLLWAILSTVQLAGAQQPLSPVQHVTFRSAMNPANTLMQMGGEINTLGRRQWVGMEGAPTVIWGNAHLGFSKLGATAGISLRHESVGVEEITETSLFFAKSVRLSEKDYLGLSLSGGLVFQQGRFSSLDPHDPAFRDDLRSTDGLIGVGLILFRPDRYYVSASMPRLMLESADKQNSYELHNHYHFSAGMLFELGEDLHLRPAVLANYAKNLGTAADFSATLFLKRQFGLGLNIRTNGDTAGILEFRYGGFGLGYAYQFNPTNRPLNRRIDNSTHEIGLTYRFGENSCLF